MHRAVKRHWLAFKQITEQSDTTLPSFVDRAFDKYLGCGDPTSGFARVRCGDCAKEQIVAFSCKARGLCTSCDAKRMAEAAAHLVDNVLPEAPYRQWVLTLPPSIRFRVARDHQLCGKLLNIGVRTVTAWYRQQARTIGMGDGLCAAISVSQRFGDGFRLNPHFHILFLDGVVCRATTPRPRSSACCHHRRRTWSTC